MTRPRIVLFAYACTPAMGSEAGSGWALTELLADVADVWVLTRPYPYRKATIEARLASLPAPERFHVVYVDLPRLVRLVGHDRLLRHGLRLQYVLWQIVALRHARRLDRRLGFQLAWHLTFSNAWLGSMASLIGPPFVYGPMGGGVGPPWRLLSALGWRGAAYEAVRGLGRAAGRYLNPLARVSWRRAALILAQNDETKHWFPRSSRHKVVVFHNIVVPASTDDVTVARSPSPTAIFAGRLLPLKGISLAIEAMRHLPGWRLVICGDGPDEARLRSHARRLGLDGQVEFRGWIERDQVLQLMREAHVMLFPSLHEEGGWAVAEAIAAGLPVIAFEGGGPAALGATTIPPGWPGDTARRLAQAARLAVDAPSPMVPEALDMATRRRRLLTILIDHGLLSSEPADGAAAQIRR